MASAAGAALHANGAELLETLEGALDRALAELRVLGHGGDRRETLARRRVHPLAEHAEHQPVRVREGRVRREPARRTEKESRGQRQQGEPVRSFNRLTPAHREASASSDTGRGSVQVRRRLARRECNNARGRATPQPFGESTGSRHCARDVPAVRWCSAQRGSVQPRALCARSAVERRRRPGSAPRRAGENGTPAPCRFVLVLSGSVDAPSSPALRAVGAVPFFRG